VVGKDLREEGTCVRWPGYSVGSGGSGVVGAERWV